RPTARRWSARRSTATCGSTPATAPWAGPWPAARHATWPTWSTGAPRRSTARAWTSRATTAPGRSPRACADASVARHDRPRRPAPQPSPCACARRRPRAGGGQGRRLRPRRGGLRTRARTGGRRRRRRLHRGGAGTARVRDHRTDPAAGRLLRRRRARPGRTPSPLDRGRLALAGRPARTPPGAPAVAGVAQARFGHAPAGPVAGGVRAGMAAARGAALGRADGGDDPLLARRRALPPEHAGADGRVRVGAGVAAARHPGERGELRRADGLARDPPRVGAPGPDAVRRAH